MATASFSVPDEVKQAFQEAFAREDRNAVIARLMQQAVEDKKRQQRRAAAIDALLDLRRQQGHKGLQGRQGHQGRKKH